MRTNWVLGTAVAALSITAIAGAQSAMKPDTMSMTYTGCVESVNHDGAFWLTRVEDGGANSMPADMTRKGDAAKTMAHEQMPTAPDKMGAMPSKSFVLAGANLKRHVGQKVSVTGSLSDGSMATMGRTVSTLSVKTLKVVAKACS